MRELEATLPPNIVHPVGYEWDRVGAWVLFFWFHIAHPRFELSERSANIGDHLGFTGQ